MDDVKHAGTDAEPQPDCECERCVRFAVFMQAEARRVEVWARALVHVAEHMAAKKAKEAN